MRVCLVGMPFFMLYMRYEWYFFRLQHLGGVDALFCLTVGSEYDFLFIINVEIIMYLCKKNFTDTMPVRLLKYKRNKDSS